METTLNKLKAANACTERYKVLLTALGKTQADDEPLLIAKIIETNGIEDAIWALRTVEGKDREIRLFLADCAEMVLPIFEKDYPNDDRPRKAIQAARDYANGLIGEEAMYAAGDAAMYAARAAAGAAASAAASAAARDAAWAAGWAAGWAAASAAARAAARANIQNLLLKYC